MRDIEVSYEIDLDIPDFLRKAVKTKIDRDAIIVYLCLVNQTPTASAKMRDFFPVATRENLTRAEILIWLHLSCDGSPRVKEISRRLRIPPKFVEEAIASLVEKKIIEDPR